MSADEAISSSLGTRLTQCTREHAAEMLDEAVARGLLGRVGDVVRAP
jgi:hypothetical protein